MLPSPVPTLSSTSTTYFASAAEFLALFASLAIVRSRKEWWATQSNVTEGKHLTPHLESLESRFAP